MHKLHHSLLIIAKLLLRRSSWLCWGEIGFAALVLTSGLYFRVWPFCMTIRSYGPLFAITLMSVVAVLTVWIAASLWLLMRPQEDPDHILRRTCLTLVLTASIGVFVSTGPRTSSIYAHGKLIRCGLTVLLFCSLQIAWFYRWERQWRNRVIQLWQERDLISWHDAAVLSFFAICFTESVSYIGSPALKTTPAAIVLNTALLAAAVCLMWAILNKGLFACGLVLACYCLLSTGNAMKLRNLYTGLQLGDHVYLNELMLYTNYLTTGRVLTFGIAILLILAICVFSWKSSKRRFPAGVRFRQFAGAAAVFTSVVVIPWIPGSPSLLRHFGVLELTWSSAHSTQRNGLLFELALQWHETYVPQPDGYDREMILHLANHSQGFAINRNGADQARPTDIKKPTRIILLIVESLIDPADLDKPLAREVLPHWNELKQTGLHGYAISPRFAGGSAESEFEIVTGLSTSFLPPNSCAYKHFLKRPTPSLISLLRSQGFHSTAIQVVPPGIYNYTEAYKCLGYNAFHSQNDLLHRQIDPQTGLISDQSVVDEILRVLDHPRSFVMAFNHATHSPYLARQLVDQPKFLNEPLTPANTEIEVYLQSINRFDRHLGQLVAELKKQEEHTILLAVGDHHPPLSNNSGAYETPAFQDPQASGELFRRRVPFVIWKNFVDVPDGSEKMSASGPRYCSMNFLSILLLDAAGITPTGQLARNRELYEQLPVVSRDIYYGQGEAQTYQSLSPGQQQQIRAYELMQYDLLIGDQYCLPEQRDRIRR